MNVLHVTLGPTQLPNDELDAYVTENHRLLLPDAHPSTRMEPAHSEELVTDADVEPTTVEPTTIDTEPEETFAAPLLAAVEHEHQQELEDFASDEAANEELILHLESLEQQRQINVQDLQLNMATNRAKVRDQAYLEHMDSIEMFSFKESPPKTQDGKRHGRWK